jgi:hypothetical protein
MFREYISVSNHQLIRNILQYGTGFSAMRKSPPPEGQVSNLVTILKHTRRSRTCQHDRKVKLFPQHWLSSLALVCFNVVPNHWDLYPTCKIATARLIALGVFFLQNSSGVSSSRSCPYIFRRQADVLLLDDAIHCHIETYYAEVSKLEDSLRLTQNRPITHDLSAPVCPEYNMFQYGLSGVWLQYASPLRGRTYYDGELIRNLAVLYLLASLTMLQILPYYSALFHPFAGCDPAVRFDRGNPPRI